MTKTATDILRQSRLFSTLNSETIERLISSSPPQKIANGKTLFSKGDPADAVYIVIKGEVAIEIISPQGQTVRVATLQQGAVFGELAVLDGGDRTADVRAAQDSKLLRIGCRAFQSLIEKSPAFSRAIIKDLIEKLRITNNQIEDISFKSLRSRLAALLIKLANNTGQNPAILQITQSALADRLSATREKVNIHLQAIQGTKAINLQRGRIEVLDLGKLSKFIHEG